MKREVEPKMKLGRGRKRPAALFVGALLVLLTLFALRLYAHQQAGLVSVVASTPGPNHPAGPVISVNDGDTIGTPLLAAPKASGKPIDGIRCDAMEAQGVHVHSHVAIFYNGRQVELPGFIGAVPSGDGGCFYWVHTHDGSGIVHIEAPAGTYGRQYTLHDLFAIWGLPVTKASIGSLRGPIRTYVNGTRIDGSPAKILLRSQQQIVIEIGSHIVTPPAYSMPEAQ